MFEYEELVILTKAMNMLGYFMTPTSKEEALLAKLNGLVDEKDVTFEEILQDSRPS